MNGKGSRYRPVNKEVFDRNFEIIFGKRELNLSKREDYEDTVEHEQKKSQTEGYFDIIRGK